ncbi:hypothetical protein L202_05851 [Cryptococcus amylolentus CBS 6039]|uniref:Uncharacterized protein n=2 Tax=Cryptococcus amylolentus TaxID=104669 RepID=A0A1E3HHP1_9TREE|nr:hypothetical protein L202_05851 [Cryptococcus amylolentus CBS 6039]ODN75859.1 hypothetical protein L202_05851 [Cryptococcus amylolentus CBS 6039]ODN97012.1 hypothetical protein I350_07990 [Cryptococcus amylolentus CBS 6273]
MRRKLSNLASRFTRKPTIPTSSSRAPRTHSTAASRETGDRFDKVTLVFPAEIEYEVNTYSGSLLSKPSTSAGQGTAADEEEEASPEFTSSEMKKGREKDESEEKSGWAAESGQKWYMRTHTLQAGTIGGTGDSVIPIETKHVYRTFPTPRGDMRKGQFTGSWPGSVAEQVKASDPYQFHPAERDFFQSLSDGEEERDYQLVCVDIVDGPGEEHEGNKVELLYEEEDERGKMARMWKRYENASWNFQAR